MKRASPERRSKAGGVITREQGEITRDQEGSPDRSSIVSGGVRPCSLVITPTAGVGADATSDATSAALLRVRVRVTTLT